MKTKTAILLMLLVALICLLAGMHIEYKHIEKNGPEPAIDTTSKTDTVYIDAPIPDIVIPDGFELVPAGTALALANAEDALELYRDSLSQKPSIVTVHDTSYIVVPMSDYHFTDSTTYEMAVRGYDVSLLWHKSFQETKYITKTEYVPEYKDYGFVLYPKADAFYFHGIYGASASLAADIPLTKDRRLKLSPEAGYAIVKIGDQPMKGYYGKATLRYDLIRIR